jgi:hypothetical protein
MVKIAFSKIKTSKIQRFQSERCLSVPFVVNPSGHWLSSIGGSFGCPGFWMSWLLWLLLFPGFSFLAFIFLAFLAFLDVLAFTSGFYLLAFIFFKKSAGCFHTLHIVENVKSNLLQVYRACTLSTDALLSSP